MDEQIISGGVNHNTNKNEALSALIALGFPKSSVEKLLDKIVSGDTKEMNVEQLIKEVLKQLR